MKNLKILSVLCCLLSVVSAVQSQTAVQWRGANRDGIYSEKGLLKTWPEGGPQLLWQTEMLGNGYGSPSVIGDRLYINGESEGISYVFALDLKGNLVWKSANGPEFMGKDYAASFPGSRSQPTVVDGLVYACSGLGRIACLEAATGKEKWAVDVVSDLKGKMGYFGYSESMLVDEKNVYCFPGGDESNIVALDKMTGKVIWNSKAKGDAVSYCSPILVKLPSKNILVNVSHDYLFGLNAANGELLWAYKEDSVKREGEYCNTPVYADGFIYGVSGVEKGSGTYKLALSPDGSSVKNVWHNEKVKNKMGGFVKLNDKLYVTSADHKLKGLDTGNGAVVDSLSNLFGGLIYADEHLYCYNDNGNVSLISLVSNKPKVVSKFKVTKGTKEHFAHPVIANGVLYIRHGNALMAYKVK
ncbi:MAG: PQQ-like beta-propeller repeat protein [Verrucomicrobia bacterium]|nr:PQQ-like beta-propeller repeat protein [Prolixibacteraceae bacterium]